MIQSKSGANGEMPIKLSLRARAVLDVITKTLVSIRDGAEN